MEKHCYSVRVIKRGKNTKRTNSLHSRAPIFFSKLPMKFQSRCTLEFVIVHSFVMLHFAIKTFLICYQHKRKIWWIKCVKCLSTNRSAKTTGRELKSKLHECISRASAMEIVTKLKCIKNAGCWFLRSIHWYICGVVFKLLAATKRKHKFHKRMKKKTNWLNWFVGTERAASYHHRDITCEVFGARIFLYQIHGTGERCWANSSC